MKLFEFLKFIEKEKYPIRLEYMDSGWINVEVDAFTERWVVSFDEDGFMDFSVFSDSNAKDSENANRLQELFERSKNSWIEAAKDLEIEFISPFIFTGSDGAEYSITGLLPQFGSEKGVLITSRKDDEESCLESTKLTEYYQTGLSPYHYDKYERESFVETLKDWGWYSNAIAPKWIGK